MGRWLDLANHMEERKGLGDNRDNRDDSSADGPNVPNVPNVQTLSALEMLNLWDQGVASVDPALPLGNYPVDRWRTIVRDCDRLLAGFGRSAAQMGWSTIDLFGFPPGGTASAHNLGGLVWRLDGSRVIAMNDRSVSYRLPFSDTTSRFSRGYLETCLDVPFVPVWELGK